VLAVLRRTGRPLSRLAAVLRRYPQVLLNVPAAQPAAPLESGAVRAAVAGAEARLAGRGRVLVRASGTEPKIRIMVEGRLKSETEAIARGLARVVTKAVEEKSHPPLLARGGKGGSGRVSR
jgi:phosphoglucosamine mutase